MRNLAGFLVLLVLALLLDIALMREIAMAWQIPADVHRFLTMTAGLLIGVYGMRAFTRVGVKSSNEAQP